ncbi:glucosamine kinase [Thermoflexales bacterium]|nr:glucosamine kinase [Thermoflexales bacterium]
MATDLIIGLDGGGSKTLALLANTEGQVLGRGTAGRSNYHAIGSEAACAALNAAVQAAFEAAHLTPQRVDAIGLGLAGVDRPPDRAVFEQWIKTQATTGVIVSDARLVLAAGTPDDWGVAVIAGTGSIVIGRDPAGRADRAGGWGYLLGDEGSGFAIGLSALRAIAQAADGRGPLTQLTDMILAHWSLSKTSELIYQVYRTPVPTQEIAALAELVEVAAAQGDEVAQTLLHEAGYELARTTQAVIKRLQLPKPVPCAIAGGALLSGERLQQAWRSAVAALGLQLDPIARVDEPAQGAVRLAQQLVASAALT